MAGLFAAALIFAAVIYNQSAVHWRDDCSDSHYYAYCGWRVSQGAVPYVDVWNNKPPGTWWMNALGFLICGPGPLREILICSAALTIGLIGFTYVARAAYSRSIWPIALIFAGVALTLVRYQCGGNRTETFVIPCEILAILGYLRFRSRDDLRWLAFGCLCAGAAPLFKQSGLGAMAACIIHYAASQIHAAFSRGPVKRRDVWRPWLIGGLAAAAPVLIAAAVLACQGALNDAYFAVWKFNRSYFDVNDAAWFSLSRIIDGYRNDVDTLYGLMFLTATGALFALFKRTASNKPLDANAHPQESYSPPTGPALFLLWLIADVYFAGVSPGRQAYHLAPSLVPAALLALYPLQWLMARRTLAQQIVARPSTAAVLAIYLYVLCSLASDSFAQANACWLTKPRWYSLKREPPAGYELQADEIRRITAPDEKIYVWGWSPGTYRYSLRHSVSRFSTLEKLGQVGKHAEFIYFGAVDDILADPPAAFAISHGDLVALLAPPRRDFAVWFDHEYEDLGDFSGMHVLKRRRPNP